MKTSLRASVELWVCIVDNLDGFLANPTPLPQRLNHLLVRVASGDQLSFLLLILSIIQNLPQQRSVVRAPIRINYCITLQSNICCYMLMLNIEDFTSFNKIQKVHDQHHDKHLWDDIYQHFVYDLHVVKALIKMNHCLKVVVWWQLVHMNTTSIVRTLKIFGKVPNFLPLFRCWND